MAASERNVQESQPAAAIDLDEGRDGWEGIEDQLAQIETAPPEAGEGEDAAGETDVAADEPVPTATDAEAPTAPEPEPPPSADASDTAAAPEAQAGPEDSGSAESLTSEPFSFKVHGRTIDVDGAEVVDLGADGGQVVTMPVETWQRHVQPYISDPQAWIQERRQLHQRIEDLDPERNQVVQRANVLVQKFNELLSDPQKLVDFVEDFDQKSATYRAEAELQIERAERERLTREHEQRENASQAEQLAPQLRSALEDAIDTVRTREFSDLNLPPEHKQQIADRLWRVPEKLFFETDAANAPAHGVAPGTVMIRDGWIKEELANYRVLVQQFASPKPNAAAKVAERNRKALGQGGKKAPPAVSAKGAATPKAVPKKAENFEEWEEQFHNMKV